MSNKSFWTSSRGMAALVMIGAVSYFLLMEHRAHLFQALPYLIILLCPLMHLFMHGGHGHHHTKENEHPGADESFQKTTEKNAAYRDGYIEGLKAGRKERTEEERHHAR